MVADAKSVVTQQLYCVHAPYSAVGVCVVIVFNYVHVAFFHPVTII